MLRHFPTSTAPTDVKVLRGTAVGRGSTAPEMSTPPVSPPSGTAVLMTHHPPPARRGTGASTQPTPIGIPIPKACSTPETISRERPLM